MKRVITYVKRDANKTTKNDIMYIELLNCMLTLKKYKLPYKAVYNRLIQMTNDILENSPFNE